MHLQLGGGRVHPQLAAVRAEERFIRQSRRLRLLAAGGAAVVPDAHAITRWLTETDRNGFLLRYFDPPLTDEQRRLADLEGWIFGVN